MKTLRLLSYCYLSFTFLACVQEAPECMRASDCGATVSTCAGCPDEAEVLCLMGACVDAQEDTVDVTGDLSLDRSIARQVVSVVHVLAHVDGADEALTCKNVWDENEAGHLAARVNVLSSGYKSISGGSYHPDLTFGRAPMEPVVLLVVATDDNAGGGNVVARGCDLNFSSGSILNVDSE